MATNHTTHFGLSQWEADDPFIRADFNEDHQKLDTALAGLSARLDALADKLAPMNYNLCSLLLRDYYEGREAGWKKAVLFDGFLDESHIASKTGATLVRDGAARVYRTAEPSYHLNSGNAGMDLRNSTETEVITATGGGRLTAVHIPCESFTGKASVAISIRRNSEQVMSHVYNADLTACTRLDIPFPESVTILPGDRYYLAVRQTLDSPIYVGKAYTGREWTLACTIDATGQTTSGTLTSKSASPGVSWDKALLWVRRTGGTVTPQVNGKSLTKTSTRETVNLQGQPCNEDCWEVPAGSGNVTVKLTLNCGGDSACLVYDYGLAMM